MLAPERDEVVGAHHLGPDEAALEVGVDGARGLGGARPGPDGRGAALVLAHGEEGDEPERAVAGVHEAGEAGLRETEPLQELEALRLRELGDLRLHLPAQDDAGAAFGRGHRLGGAQPLVGAGELRLVHVGDEDDRLRREEEEVRDGGALGVPEALRPQRLAALEACLHAVEGGELELRRLALLAGGLRVLRRPLAPLLDRREVLQHELGVDHVAVACGIDLAHHVHDVRIVEAAQHVRDRIHLADVGEKLVPEPLAARGPGDEAGDVHELERGRGRLLRPEQRRELLEPRVGHRHDAHVGIDGAEGVVLGRSAGGARERVEKGRLPHVGEADDADAERHVLLRQVEAGWRASPTKMAPANRGHDVLLGRTAAGNPRPGAQAPAPRRRTRAPTR